MNTDSYQYRRNTKEIQGYRHTDPVDRETRDRRISSAEKEIEKAERIAKNNGYRFKKFSFPGRYRVSGNGRVFDIHPSTQRVFAVKGSSVRLVHLPEWSLCEMVSILCNKQQRQKHTLRKVKDPNKKREKAEKKPKAPAKPQKRPFVVPPYHEYIVSPEWKKIRISALKESGFQCSICKSPDNLHVHHKHYRTLGRETLEDLQVLCQDCHAIEHERQHPWRCDSLSREFRDIVG